jgi:hypothetical protein
MIYGAYLFIMSVIVKADRIVQRHVLNRPEVRQKVLEQMTSCSSFQRLEDERKQRRTSRVSARC